MRKGKKTSREAVGKGGRKAGTRQRSEKADLEEEDDDELEEEQDAKEKRE